LSFRLTASMSLRCFIVRRCLHASLEAAGLRAVNLPLVVDARQHVHPPVPLDAGYLVVDRRAFARITFPRAEGEGAAAMQTVGFASLSGVLRAICAERIGLAGRAAMPGPRRALELRREGRWSEVLEASERVEAPMRARLDSWLRGWRFGVWRWALQAFKRL
ncbi:MAG: hypothetical protein ACJ8IK_09010, partial [Burkholderiaceae bacterium]